MERLHKVLAHCGVGSRRECEALIAAGRVEVDDEVVTTLGTKVDPATARIKVDGERVVIEPPVYYLVNKPRGVLCTNRDDFGRPTVVDLIRDEKRIYTVGRLDEASEGLILCTNDGDLANVISHPRYQVDKTYRITVRGPVSEEQVARIEAGVWLAEGKTGPAQVRRVDSKGQRSIVTVTLWEGRNRELRRIFAKVGLRVTHLVRTAIGPLKIEDLATGAYRKLQADELRFAAKRLRPGWKPKPVPAGGERGGRKTGRTARKTRGRGPAAGARDERRGPGAGARGERRGSGARGGPRGRAGDRNAGGGRNPGGDRRPGRGGNRGRTRGR